MRISLDNGIELSVDNHGLRIKNTINNTELILDADNGEIEPVGLTVVKIIRSLKLLVKCYRK